MSDLDQVVHKKAIARVRDYRQVFSSQAGQRVLQDMMQTHFVLASTFTKDTNLMLLHEGERNVVLRILAQLKVRPEELLNMLEEIHANGR